MLGKWINRLGIGLPVASDPGFALWQQFDLQAWPSVVVLDIDGSVDEVVIGDSRSGQIEACIGELLDRHDGLLVSGEDRKSVVEGKSVSVRCDLGGPRIIKKKKKNKNRR